MEKKLTKLNSIYLSNFLYFSDYNYIKDEGILTFVKKCKNNIIKIRLCTLIKVVSELRCNRIWVETIFKLDLFKLNQIVIYK